tara:strand:- start:896 stop:1240 length:345 start_codon:yes stop_codon:yes gene_type:complete
MNFQKVVVIIAIVVLIILLSWIGYAMYKNQHSGTFPPVVAQCPDYWDVSGNNLCINTRSLGTCAIDGDKSMNFDQDQFKGAEGSCQKYRWARGCGVSWSGITNDPNICDSVTNQ